MKVVILAGGYGTRIQEETQSIPKPMIELGGKPILWHIMQIYIKAGFKEFIIALGYKSNIVKQYFLNYHLMSSDFEVNLSNGNLEIFNKVNSDVKVKLIETGLDTKTGGRIKKLKKYISDETFFLTYGDGLSDIDINNLLEFHKSKNKLITMTVVRPPARFGVLDIEDNGLIKSFKEKPQLQKGWINGGFFVVEPKFLDFCLSDQEMLEKEPIQRALSIKELVAYKYSGFWKCMDNLRDKKDFEKMISEGEYPWIKD